MELYGALARAGRHNKENTRQRQCEEHQQNVSAPEEQCPCEHDKNQKSADKEILHAVYHNGLLCKELVDVIKGLQHGRPFPALHSGSDLTVNAFQEAADKRRAYDIQNGKPEIF